MSKAKVRIPHGDAVDRILPVIKALGGLSDQVTIAGSLRRGSETIGDGDLVVTQPVDRVKLEEAIQGISVGGGEAKLTLCVEDFNIDVVVCLKEERGAALMYLTGPVSFNVEMRRIALDSGMILNRHGLWKDDKRVAGATENEIFDTLGLLYQNPCVREKGPRADPSCEQIVWSMEVPSTKGDKRYLCKLNNAGTWHCSCPAFKWSKKKVKTCKHLDKTAKPAYEAR